MFNKIKSLALSFLVTLPSIGYSYENLAQDIIDKDLNRSFALHLNDVTGSESYFHSPQMIDVDSFRSISKCKEYGHEVARSYKQSYPDKDVIVTERSLLLFGETNTESSILIYLVPNQYIGGWAVGQTFYCMKKPDGTAEQLSFTMEYGGV